MFNIVFNDGITERTIVGVPDGVGTKLYNEAKTARLHSELYDFEPGDICMYKIDTNDYNPEYTNYFCIIKIWFESIDDGRFNAIQLNGDVIENGTLDLIVKIGHINDQIYNAFINEFHKEISSDSLHDVVKRIGEKNEICRNYNNGQ